GILFAMGSSMRFLQLGVMRSSRIRRVKRIKMIKAFCGGWAERVKRPATLGPSQRVPCPLGWQDQKQKANKEAGYGADREFSSLIIDMIGQRLIRFHRPRVLNGWRQSGSPASLTNHDDPVGLQARGGSLSRVRSNVAKLFWTIFSRGSE